MISPLLSDIFSKGGFKLLLSNRLLLEQIILESLKLFSWLYVFVYAF